ncbi:MAG: sugar nucleotide-binding protein [Acidimicrobiales bacterium]
MSVTAPGSARSSCPSLGAHESDTNNAMRQGPLLVTGASGYLGSHLCQAWNGGTVGVSCLVRRVRVRVRACGRARAELDLRDSAQTRRLLDDLAPRASCIVRPRKQVLSDDDLRRVNAEAAGTLASWCAENGARLVALSSDMVHDGRSGPYADDASPTPMTPYGQSKAQGEQQILASNPAAVIVRTSLIYGLASIDRGTAGLADRLDAGELITLWQDVLRQPMEITALAAALAGLVERPDVHGVLNIAGRDPLSRADFALMMLQLGPARPRDRDQSHTVHWPASWCPTRSPAALSAGPPDSAYLCQAFRVCLAACAGTSRRTLVSRKTS